MTEYHVSTSGSDANPGTAEQPFATVNHAAQIADAGDTVVVHEGTYREWVRPLRGGRSDARRITYVAAPGEKVKITGAEQVTDWTDEGDGVWRAEVPNTLFGEWNPFAEEVAGDWVVRRPGEPVKHLGEVYLNGVGSYEVGSRAEVAKISERTEIVDDWSGAVVPVVNVPQTRRRWYAEVGAESTAIWASFDGADPTAELVEINVRQSVFYPTEHHCDYITVRGFELAQAACPWTPPTADQPGLIGPNWAKGWIIEDNHIHDIAIKREFYGYEIAGIKLHAAIDVEIRGNRINDCSLGTWLDWQT